MNDAPTTPAPKVIRLAALEKAIVGMPCASGGVCSRSRDGCVIPNLAINARAEDRALKIKNRFVRWFEGPDGRCLDFRH